MPNTIAAMVREPSRRPSSRATLFWALTALIGWCIVLLVELGLTAMTDSWASGWFRIGFIVTGAIGIVHVIVMPPWRYRVHRWDITDDAVFTRSGWFTQESRVAPIARIQTIDSRRGFFQRMMRLTSVIVTTASAAGPLVIHALDDDVARDVVAHLTQMTERTPGDAT